MSERYFVAAGKTDLTPGRALPLAGYTGTTRLGAVGSTRLEANVLALVSEGGSPVVFAGLDLLYMGQIDTDLREAMSDVAPQEIFLAASHTHFAPSTEPLLPALGAVDEGYVNLVATELRALIESALDELTRRRQPCRLTVAVVPYQSAVNRRRAVGRIHSSVRSLPNWSAPRDDLIRVIVARSEDDQRPLGAIWNHACHPVGSPHRDAVSPDFPGVVRERLRTKWIADVPIVFLQGFAGDLRPPAIAPRIPNSLSELRRRISTIRRGFGAFSPREWNEWSGNLAAAVAAGTEHQPRSISGPIEAARAVIPLSELVTGVPDDLVFSLHVVRCGSDVTIVGMSAEVVVELLPEVVRRVKGEVIVPVGYIDRTVSYLPTQHVLQEGGYEAGDFTGAFGLPWRFKGDPESTALLMLDRLAVSSDARTT